MKKTVLTAAIMLVLACGVATAPVKETKSCSKCTKETTDDNEESFTWDEDDPFSLETVDIPENFDDLKAFAEKILTDVQKNTSKDPATFHKYKAEIDTVDDKLDLYDDALEVQFSDGKIKPDVYEKLEKSIDAIDDILDKAEETLEKQFGFED